MECLVEILIQIFGEFIFGALFELIAEGLGRFIAWMFKPLPLHGAPRDPQDRLNLGRAILWQLIGVAAGFTSLLILPHHIIHKTALHVLNLIVTPVLMAAFMVQWGQFWSRRSKLRTPLNHFACAYGFALFYLIIRFFLAH